MAKKLKTSHLLQVSKGKAETLNHFRLGILISSTSGLTIERLIENAARDRFQLAQNFLRLANRIIDAPTPQYRLALARAYYAMYHAARSVVFFVERGDDHEAHSELPKHLPKDFPDRDAWENQIKTARLERNRADYDPYPKTDRAFSDAAKGVVISAAEFVSASRRYLARKGCEI